MAELKSLLGLLEVILEDPWLLSFAGIWLIGYLLKEHSPLNNNVIPWVISVVGSLLGFLLIQSTLKGVIIGALIGYIQIGFYEHIKATLKLIKGG